MKIVINTATQCFGGSVQVALSFIHECIHFPEHEYHVWVGPGIRESLRTQDFPDNFKFYDFNFGAISLSTVRKIQQNLTPLDKKIRPDVIITTSGPSYFKSKTPQLIGFNLGLYLYPESPYLIDLPLKKKLKLYLKKKIHYYFFKRDATAYVTQTEDVNRKVRRALKTDRVYTVSNTFNNFYKGKKVYPNRLPKPQKGEIRLLTISAYYPHKNLEIIPEIISYLEKKGINNIRFILTLKERDFIKRIENKPGIFNVGPVKPEECPSLYEECDIVFLPTLAECFSASYPEAMVMGKPIVTTNLGFARSICGDAALYYEPKNAKKAAETILHLVGNKKLRADLINKGLKQLGKFDTARSRAKKYLEICKSISEEDKGSQNL